MNPQLQANRALHFSCAVVTILIAAISFLAKCTHETKNKNANSRRHTLRFLLVGSLVSCYIAEAAIVTTDGYGSTFHQAHLFHLIALTLVCLFLGFRQSTSPSEIGILAATVTLFETPILVLSFFHRLDPRQISQLVLQACRLLILIFLLIINYREASVCKTLAADARPLLANGEHTLEGTAYGTGPLAYDSDASGNGQGPNNQANSGGDSDGDDDEEEDEHMKEFRAKRLKEAGGWWSYISDFSPLWPYLIPRKDRKVQACLVAGILCLACNRALNVLVPRQLGLVTDKLLDKSPPYSEMGIWLLLSLLSGDSGLGLIQELVQIPVKQFSYRQITNSAFNHVMSLSMDFHSERDTAELLKAVDQGAALTRLLETAVIDMAPTFVDLFVAFVFLYWKFNGYVALAMGVAFVSYGSLEVLSSTWNLDNRREWTKAEREESRAMHQAVQGWQTVSYFNMFPFERQRIGSAVERHLEKTRNWTRRDAYIKAILELLVPTTLFTLGCLVIYEISNGRKSPGDFVFLIQYWDYLVYPIQSLSREYRWLLSDLVGAERLLELFQMKSTVADREDATDLGVVKGTVDFKHVHFSYNPRKPTLEDVNFTAKPGETVALVGETGAGKSSMIKLLFRFYDVTSGRIEVDGRDIRDATLSSLRRVFGVVPQDPLLFNASIMENLRYARPGTTDAEVEAACRAAAIHDKILSFPNGYDTGVGENGVKLSGGEVQRLAIARVFLKDPQVLILDEATSAVDTNTESEIQTALDKLRAGRTTFVIAHRLSTVVNADRILVLHEGRVVESGSHQELLRQGGRYKSLWMKQVAGVGSGELIQLES